MIKLTSEEIFLNSEGDKYFDRNGPIINKGILEAVKFLKPSSKLDILEIGCGCGSTLREIKFLYKSNVYGLDASKKAINFAKKKNKLKNVFHRNFLSYKNKKKFDIIISGGFFYVLPIQLLKKSIKKIFNLMKTNSYFIMWDYDTPYDYINSYKHNKKIKSYKRNNLNIINNLNKKLYLVSKQLLLKDGTKISFYNNTTDIDKIFAVMIFKKIK